MSAKQSRKIVLVGASGTIGTPTLTALLSSGANHTITVITRAESNAIFPESVVVLKGDYSNESFLTSALTGQDVLVFQLANTAYSHQTALIHAAAKAGVQYVLPTEFGSDMYAPLSDRFPMKGEKQQYRDLVEKLGMSWIAVVNNPWFDWSLKRGLWGVDIASRKATLYAGAEAKFNTTSLHQVGNGVAALLSLSEEQLATFKNRPVYLSSFEVTQREILSSAIQATGTKESDWDIKTENVHDAIAESRKESVNGNLLALIKEFYVTHMIEGLGGNFQSKAVKDAAVLGLKEENLDEIMRAVVEDIASN